MTQSNRQSNGERYGAAEVRSLLVARCEDGEHQYECDHQLNAVRLDDPQGRLNGSVAKVITKVISRVKSLRNK